MAYSLDGQRLHEFLQTHKNANAVISEFLGVAAALIYDDELSKEDVDFLRSWKDRHREHLDSWPLCDLRDLLDSVFADGTVADDERQRIGEFLRAYARIHDEDRVASGVYDTNPKISFRGRTFLFTGELEFADRGQAEDLVRALGGAVSESAGFTLSVNYLVVGSRGSDAWTKGKWGSKI